MPTTCTPAGLDVIAELQRQQAILNTARDEQTRNGQQPPASGTPAYETWARATLKAAGETHIIRDGRPVPLTDQPTPDPDPYQCARAHIDTARTIPATPANFPALVAHAAHARDHLAPLVNATRWDETAAILQSQLMTLTRNWLYDLPDHAVRDLAVTRGFPHHLAHATNRHSQPLVSVYALHRWLDPAHPDLDPYRSRLTNRAREQYATHHPAPNALAA